MARLVAYGHAGVDPRSWASARCRRSRKALERAGLKVERHRRDRSQRGVRGPGAARCRKELDLDPAKVNPNGSGISLGHPVGATGAIITTKALLRAAAHGGRYALVTMCIGGGQGIAAIFERV